MNNNQIFVESIKKIIEEFNIESIISAWNNQADEFNSWTELDSDERMEFTINHIKSKITAILN